MLQDRNNNIHTAPSNRGKGIVGTLLIHLGLGLLLFSLSFAVPDQKNTIDEGIMVNFGTGETGIGDIEPSPPAVAEEAHPLPTFVPEETPSTPSAASKKTQEEALLAGKDAETPKVKKADPEAEKKRLEKIEANKKLKEERAAEKIRKDQEEAERKQKEADQQRQTDIMNRTKNALVNSKNSGTNSTGEGVAGGPGNQGVVTGSVDSKVRGDGNGTGTSGVGNGISYDLAGRGVQELISPKYEIQKEGIVVVDISVDQDGNVTQAIPGGKGTTELDKDLLKVAKEAALKTKFVVKKDAPPVQKGTIKYIFKLK